MVDETLHVRARLLAKTKPRGRYLAVKLFVALGVDPRDYVVATSSINIYLLLCEPFSLI